MMNKLLWLMMVLLSMAACVQRPIHQGNEITKKLLTEIHVGDTKFDVERLWGSPAILDPLHPNRVEYVQQVKDQEKKEDVVRGVVVEYDRALRVQSIRPFGFQ